MRRNDCWCGWPEVAAYPLDPRSGLVDYEALTKLAQNFRPRVILARAASSPRLLDLVRFRSVCDHVGAILLTDYAQVGLLKHEKK